MHIRVHEGNETLKAQWELFGRSMGVVGPHGAGLTNMLVMKSPSVIVEVIDNPAASECPGQKHDSCVHAHGE